MNILYNTLWISDVPITILNGEKAWYSNLNLNQWLYQVDFVFK